jgi:hypothetical protein
MDQESKASPISMTLLSVVLYSDANYQTTKLSMIKASA